MYVGQEFLWLSFLRSSNVARLNDNCNKTLKQLISLIPAKVSGEDEGIEIY